MAFRLGGIGRRPPRAVMLAVGVSAVALLAGGFALVHPGARKSDGGLQTLVIQPRRFVSTISVAGTIVPGDNVVVTAPFDGVATRVGFDYGAPVAQGQVLVELDTAEIRQRRNEAEASFLKASQNAADMAAWDSGPEVSRARRARAAADFDLRDTQRKVEETRALLDRGLVARNESDSLAQQLRNQQMALAAADQDLATALERGKGANRLVATLELENARARLAELDAQLAGAVVRSPATGVIVNPPADRADTPVTLHPGLRLTKGQLIGAIARSGGLAVSFRLGETDANRIRPGQEVSVTGPGFGAFTAHGRVTSVGAEALPLAAAGGPMASFAAIARLDPLTPAQAQAIRIGMTANLAIAVYTNPAALVAPPAAIQGAAPAATLSVKDSKGGVRAVPIQLGQSAPDGIEVLSGLKPGDVVVWTSPTPAGEPGAGAR